MRRESLNFIREDKKMEIRLQGTKNECDEAMEKLKQVFTIESVSRFYENRHNERCCKNDELVGRVYVEVKE